MAVQCSAEQCNYLQSHAVETGVVKHSAVQCNALLLIVVTFNLYISKYQAM